MKLFTIICLFTITTLGTLVGFYALLPWAYLPVVAFMSILTFLFYWFYPDKIILGFLGAKEINQGDYESSFQILKNVIFRKNLNLPKLYIIQLSKLSSFLIEARGEKTIILSSEIINNNDKKILWDTLEKIYDPSIRSKRNVLSRTFALICFMIGMCRLSSKVFSLGNQRLRITIFMILLWIINPINEMVFLLNRKFNQIEIESNVMDQVLQTLLTNISHYDDSIKVESLSQRIILSIYTEFSFRLEGSK